MLVVPSLHCVLEDIAKVRQHQRARFGNELLCFSATFSRCLTISFFCLTVLLLAVVYGESTSEAGVHCHKVYRSVVLCLIMYVLGFIESNDPNDVHNVLVLSYVVGFYICSCLCRETLPVTVNNLGHKRR